MTIREPDKEYLKGFLTAYVHMVTEPDPKKGRNKYICPLPWCGSGTGKNRSGAFTISDDGKAWKCFSCGEGGDLFTLIEKLEGIHDFKEQLRRAEEIAGLPSSEAYAKAPYITKNNMYTEEPENRVDMERWKKNSRAYLERCATAAGRTDYFAKRGFTEKEVRAFGMGYDPGHNGRPGIVIPYNNENLYYVIRYTDNGEQKYYFPKNTEAGPRPIFRIDDMYTEKPCFICEGQLNALSIIAASSGSCGAIGLGGTSGADLLLRKVAEKRPSCTLIVSMDPDEPGQKAAQKLTEGLKELNIPYIEAQYTTGAYPEGSKDPNDYLVSNRAQLQKDVEANVTRALSKEEAKKDPESIDYEEYIKFMEEHHGKNALELLKHYDEWIQDPENTKYIPTGFNILDNMLDGGLYPGLYILGAVSSIGKTTLLLQMADQIAAAGTDVVYFSLEMEAYELISKSISRLTFEHCNGYTPYAKTTRGVSTASRYKKYNDRELEIIKIARRYYAKTAENLYIYEGVGDMGVKQIRDIVEKHKATSLSGKYPVVMIDYLQILAPYDVRSSDKQNTDKAVLELKRISRDFRTPVIAVSSFNRDSYVNAVNMAAFKESGAIEYGSDVLMALQPAGLQTGKNDNVKDHNQKVMDKHKASESRNVELVILKNRNGKSGVKVDFTYRPLFNYFEDKTHQEDEEDAVII